MSENQEAGQTPRKEIDPEVYLDSIGVDNKKNVMRLRDAIMGTAQELGIGSFMLAVGGTVEKPNPDKRKDVDIRVGVQIDTKDIPKYPHLERHKKQFEKWNVFVQKAVTRLNVEQEFEVEVDPPRPDRDYEEIAGNDGMVRLIPKSGVPIEILCYQEGSLIKPPFVKLFSNIELNAA